MPFKSQAQRGLAHAVASGKAKNTGMSKAAARELIADDPGGKLPKRKNSSMNKSLGRSIRRNSGKG